MQRVDAYFDPRLAAAALVALRGAVGPDVKLAVLGAAAEVWAAAAVAAQFECADPAAADILVVTDPSSTSVADDVLGARVAELTSGAHAVVLATASPSGALGSGARWPGEWADAFAQHRWRYADVLRRALWDDPRFGPDPKEGLLLFLAHGAFPAVGADPASAVVHPDRLVSAVGVVHAELDALRRQFLDGLQPMAHRREVDLARQRIAELAETIERQRQHDAAVEARLAATERRVLLLMEQQLGLGGPLGAAASEVAAAPTGRTRRLLGFLLGRVEPEQPASVFPTVTPTVAALFDTASYLAEHPEAAEQPLAHYLARGEVLGHRPNAWFDPLFYRERNPDVVRAGVSPLVHYAEYGGAEGRPASAEFDTQWYVSTYPEVRQSGLQPMLHFMAVGAALGYRTRAQAVPTPGDQAHRSGPA